jgi:hypothetical protein
MVISLVGLGPENDCPGEGQQQLQTADASSRQRGCYTRTMTECVQLKKKRIAGRESQWTWHQDELIGGKPPVVQ